MDDAIPQPPLPPLPDSVIPPARYSDPATFEEERRRIFRRCWMYVGVTDDLRDDNDFITTEIAGTSVLVQNFGGELRAFHNVCTHRYSLIHLKPCGNGKPVCPYHGWVFNRDGVPVGIPGNAKYFGFDEAAKRARALPRFELAVRGRFLFVRLEPGGPTLDEHLGDYGPVLDHLSETFVDTIDRGALAWAANWKTGVESVLEVYHVDATHPETFKKFTKKIWLCSYTGAHSRGTTHLADGSVKWWDGVVSRLGLVRSAEYRNYDHFFIFPNLAIGLTHGALMSVQTYDPVDSERCLLSYRLFLADSVKPQTRGGPVRKAVEDNVRGFNLQVLDEDRIVSEAVHRGAKQVTAPAVPGWCEERIHAFHAAWFERMEG